MDFEQYLIFLAITLAWMFTPGPTTLFSVNNGIRYGAKRAVLAAFGNILAFQVLVLLSIAQESCLVHNINVNAFL